jgi:predicted aspartyl protease
VAAYEERKFAMSIFVTKLSATNSNDRARHTPQFDALVDTGSHMSWIPKDALIDAGIAPEGKKRFRTATNQLSVRDYGYAILSAEGYRTVDEVVFAEKGDSILLGVRTIEGFGVMVDNVKGRFVPVEGFVTGIALDNSENG